MTRALTLVRRLAIAAFVVCAMLPGVLKGVTVTWNGGDFSWTVPDSNSFGIDTYNNGNDVLFTGLGTGSSIAVTAGGVAPNSLTFSNTIGQNYTFSGGPITGSTGLVQTGTGNVTLGMANTYTGATTVSAGILIANISTALPSATALTITSPGEVRTKNNQVIGSLAGSGTLRALDGNGNITVGSDGTSTLFSGAMANFSGGSGVFIKIGSGTLTFTSAVNPAVGTLLQGGGLTLSSAGSLTGGSIALSHGTVLTLDNAGTNNLSRIQDGSLTMNGGELVFIGNAGAASSESSNSIIFGAGNSIITINPGAGQSATINQSWNGGDLLVNPGASALIRGPNLGSVAGPNVAVFQAWDFDIPSRQKGGGGAANTTTINIFPHLIGDTSASGDGAGFITFAAGSPTIARLLNTATEYAATITSGSGVLDNVRLTGAVAGINASTTINALLLTAGGSVAGSGTLNLNTNDILATATGTSIGVGTLAFGTGEGFVRVTSGSDLTISSQITGTSATAYGLTKGGSGNLILSGTGNSYTKTTQINAGTLTVTSNGVLGATGTGNGTTVMSGGTLAFDGGVNYTTAEAVTASGTGVGGTGVLRNVSGSNSFAGQVTLAADSVLGATAGTLTLTTPVLGNFAVSKVGAGTLRLTGPLTTSAATTVSLGTLQAGAADALIFSPLTVTAGATFDMNGFNQHLYSLTGPAGAAVSLGGATLSIGQGNSSTTFAGSISGAGASALTKIGTGTLSLTGVNSYAGATMVNGGTLALNGAAGALGGTSGVTVNAGGTLTLDNTANNNTDRIANTATLAIAGGTLNFLGNAGAASSEAAGNTTFGGPGGTVVTLTPGAGQSVVLTGANLAIGSRGVTLARGTNLGSALGANVAQIKFTGTVQSVGGGGAAGTTTVNTIPHVIGDISASGIGTDFVTYDASNGIRLLTGAEYATTFASGNATLDNVSLSIPVTGINAATSINALKFQSGGSVAGTGTLTVNSGDILATAAGTTLGMTTLAFGAAQGTFYTAAATDTLAVTGAITGTGGIVKGGAGTLTMTLTGALPTGPVTVAGGKLDISAANSKLPVLGALYVAPGATLTYRQIEYVGSLAGGGTLVGTVGNNYFRFGYDNTDTTFSGSFNQNGGSPTYPGLEKIGTGTTTILQSLGTLGSSAGVVDGTLRFYGNGSIGNVGTAVFPGATVIVDDTLTHVDNRTGATTLGGEYKVIGSNSANSTVGRTGNTGFYFSGPGNPTLTLVPGAGFQAQYQQSNGGDNGQFSISSGAVALVRGDNLGQATGTRSKFTIRTQELSIFLLGGAGATFADALTGQAGTWQVSVLYRAYGDTVSSGLGSGFVTYDRGTDHNQDITDPGVRPLTASEYNSALSNGDGSTLSTIANTRLSSAVTGINSATRINSLILDQGGAISGSGATLTVYSGLIMSTGTNGAISTTGLDIPSVTQSGSFAGVATVTHNQLSLITPTASSRLTISSAIGSSLAGGLVKVGQGTVILSGANSYTGTTVIAGGALHAVDGSSLPSTSNLDLTGGVFESNGTFSRSLGAGVTNVQWDQYSSGGFAAQGGALNIQLNGGGGAVAWNGGSFVQGQRSLIFGSVTADSVVDFQNALNLGTFGAAGGDRTESTNRTVQVVDNPNSIADRAMISGQITGGDANLTFRKIGSGTLVLSNANNTYVTPTQVVEGTLLVNGTLNTQGAAATVTVNSGATLGGIGTINRPVVVNDGAILAPGTSPGTLTLGGGLLLNNASLLSFELGPSGIVGLGVNDLVHVDGAFTLDGILNVTQLAGFGPQPGGLPGTYRLFDYTGSFTDNGLLIGTLGPNSGGWIGTVDLATIGQVNLTVIPEPATLGLLALGGLLALRRRGRRA